LPKRRLARASLLGNTLSPVTVQQPHTGHCPGFKHDWVGGTTYWQCFGRQRMRAGVIPKNATHAGRLTRRRRAPQGAWMAMRSGVGCTAYWERNGIGNTTYCSAWLCQLPVALGALQRGYLNDAGTRQVRIKRGCTDLPLRGALLRRARVRYAALLLKQA
jgi:hypothetical protein